MNTKQMEYILELSKMKNFNRAAENLFISQPALTYQIKTVEDEIGFRIFERSGRGVTLTAAGGQFVIVLQNVLDELEDGIRLGQMHDMSFSDNVSIGLPYRSAIYYLPEAANRFREIAPKIPVTPYFGKDMINQPQGKLEHDIEFSIQENARRMSGIKEYPLFQSRIYCILPKDDPLAGKKIITPADIKDRKLISNNTRYPNAVHHVMRDVMQTYHNNYYLTEDTATILHAVASHAGVSLVPGIVNDHSGELAWIPFDCNKVLHCLLLTDASEKRKNVLEFIRVLIEVYAEHAKDPL